MKFHLGFTCSISSGALTDNIFAVLETSEFFLSKAVNYMHSRASFRDKISCLKRDIFLSKNEKSAPYLEEVLMARLGSERCTQIIAWCAFSVKFSEI